MSIFPSPPVSIEETKSLLKTTFSQHTHNIALWGGFLTASLLVYFFFSSGDFSFLLTYAAFMRCFGLGLLNFKMISGKSASGVSIKTLELYFVVFVARLCAIMRHQGYLPYDKTGDWFYHFVEMISSVFAGVAIFLIFYPLISTYGEKYDKFGNFHIPNQLGALYLLVPCIALAVLIHPSLNHDWFSDVCWTLSMYLESVAIFPQLFMFQKQASSEGGVVEALIGHTVFALGFSRVFELIFWISSFKELMLHGNSFSGWLVLLCQLLHLGLMSDFFYIYIKSVTAGTPMELPKSIYTGADV